MQCFKRSWYNASMTDQTEYKNVHQLSFIVIWIFKDLMA